MSWATCAVPDFRSSVSMKIKLWPMHPPTQGVLRTPFPGVKEAQASS